MCDRKRFSFENKNTNKLNNMGDVWGRVVWDHSGCSGWVAAARVGRLALTRWGLRCQVNSLSCKRGSQVLEGVRSGRRVCQMWEDRRHFAPARGIMWEGLSLQGNFRHSPHDFRKFPGQSDWSWKPFNPNGASWRVKAVKDPASKREMLWGFMRKVMEKFRRILRMCWVLGQPCWSTVARWVQLEFNHKF